MAGFTQQERADMLSFKRDFSVEPLKNEHDGADDGVLDLVSSDGSVISGLYICQECSTAVQSEEPPEGWYIGNGFVLCSWCRGSSESYDKYNPVIEALRELVDATPTPLHNKRQVEAFHNALEVLKAVDPPKAWRD